MSGFYPGGLTTGTIRDQRNAVVFEGEGQAIESVYNIPPIDPGYQQKNADWSFWWDWPWDWGDEGKKNEEQPTPEALPPGGIAPEQEFFTGTKVGITGYIGVGVFILLAYWLSKRI